MTEIRSPLNPGLVYDSLSVDELAGIVRHSLLAENWRVIGDPQQPDFENDFDNYDPITKDTAAFYKNADGEVRLRGHIFSRDDTISVGTPKAAFTLGSDYWPENDQVFIDVYNDQTVTLTITTTGEVRINARTDAAADIDAIVLTGISYRVT